MPNIQEPGRISTNFGLYSRCEKNLDTRIINTSEKTRKKCRILYLVGQLGPGGLERQLVGLLEVMNRGECSPLVVVWNFQGNDTYVRPIQKLGVEVVALPRNLSPFGKLWQFGQLAKELNPEVIHSYSFYTNFAAYWGGLLTGAVAVGALQSDFITEKKVSGVVLGRLSALFPKVHISNNSLAAENVRKAVGIFLPKKVVVVRNGLDLKIFRNCDFPTFQKVSILAVGSLLPVKRWDRLLRASAELKRMGYDFVVRLVGGGPLRSSLEEQAQSLGLVDSFEFLGHRSDIPALLADSLFLVHTSDREGCPNVITEAMACGRAVVATNVGEVPMLIEDGKTGYVVGRDEPENLINRMKILIIDQELCRRMGKAGRFKAEKEFGVDRLLSETLAVYRTAGWRMN